MFSVEKSSQKRLDCLVAGIHLFFGLTPDFFAFYASALFPAANLVDRAFSDEEIALRVAGLRNRHRALISLLEKRALWDRATVERMIRVLIPECFLSLGTIYAYSGSLLALRTNRILDSQLERLYKVQNKQQIEEWLQEVPLGGDPLSHPLLWDLAVEAILLHAIEKYCSDLVGLQKIAASSVQRLDMAWSGLSEFGILEGNPRGVRMLVKDFQENCLYVYGYNANGTINKNGITQRVDYYLKKALPGDAYIEWRTTHSSLIEEKAISKCFDGFRRLFSGGSLDGILCRIAKSQVRDFMTVNTSWMTGDIAIGNSREISENREPDFNKELVNQVRSFGIEIEETSQSCVEDALYFLEQNIELVGSWLNAGKKARERFCVLLAVVLYSDSSASFELKKTYTQQQIADLFGISRRSVVSYTKTGRALIRKSYGLDR